MSHAPKQTEFCISASSRPPRLSLGEAEARLAFSPKDPRLHPFPSHFKSRVQFGRRKPSGRLVNLCDIEDVGRDIAGLCWFEDQLSFPADSVFDTRNHIQQPGALVATDIEGTGEIPLADQPDAGVGKIVHENIVLGCRAITANRDRFTACAGPWPPPRSPAPPENPGH